MLNGEGCLSVVTELYCILFVCFVGKTFVAPWVKDQKEIKKLFPVTLKSSSGSNKSSQSAALCQWSEVPQHPGLVCCLTHTAGVPVVLMIKPHQILVQTKSSSASIDFVLSSLLELVSSNNYGD